LTDDRRGAWWVGAVLGLAIVLAVAYFAWPTPWEVLVEDAVRLNRITGEYQMRIDGAWRYAVTYPTEFAPGPPGRPLEELSNDLPVRGP
jgi:hypothetical protein